MKAKRLNLGQVSGNLYDVLAWLSRHDVFGCSAEDVALFLLTREVEHMMQTGYLEKVAAFSKWLDAEMAKLR